MQVLRTFTLSPFTILVLSEQPLEKSNQFHFIKYSLMINILKTGLNTQRRLMKAFSQTLEWQLFFRSSIYILKTYNSFSLLSASEINIKNRHQLKHRSSWNFRTFNFVKDAWCLFFLKVKNSVTPPTWQPIYENSAVNTDLLPLKSWKAIKSPIFYHCTRL